jgi:hypothetical protein
MIWFSHELFLVPSLAPVVPLLDFGTRSSFHNVLANLKSLVSKEQFLKKFLPTVPAFMRAKPSVAVLILLVSSSLRRFNSINLHD